MGSRPPIKTRPGKFLHDLACPTIRHPDGIMEWKLNAAYRIVTLGLFPLTLLVLALMIGFGKMSLVLLIALHLSLLALACACLARRRLREGMGIVLASSTAAAFLYLFRIGQPDGLYFLSFVIIIAGMFLGVLPAFLWAGLNSAIVAAASFRVPGLAFFPSFPAYFLDHRPAAESGVYVSTIIFLFLASAFLSIVFQSYFSELLGRIRLSQEERLLLETELLQAQKMEAIGMLASGIAHDFGHGLTRIKSCANLILKKLHDPEPEVGKYASAILASCDQFAQSSLKLLSFARRKGSEKAIVSAHDLVETVVSLLQLTVEKDIRFQVHLEAEHHAIRGSFPQLQGMLMNLAVNAIDAIPRKGTVTFATRCGERSLEGGPAAPCLILTVSDDGVGIDEAIKDRIFEPFFTSKPAGQGSGLGLALAVRIVRNHNGLMECESEKGKGTIFRISLPLAQSRSKRLQ
jgi:signal transduction histidine kinase